MHKLICRHCSVPPCPLYVTAMQVPCAGRGRARYIGGSGRRVGRSGGRVGGGGIAGAAIAGVVVIVILLLLLYCFYRVHKRKQAQQGNKPPRPQAQQMGTYGDAEAPMAEYAGPPANGTDHHPDVSNWVGGGGGGKADDGKAQYDAAGSYAAPPAYPQPAGTGAGADSPLYPQTQGGAQAQGGSAYPAPAPPQQGGSLYPAPYGQDATPYGQPQVANGAAI
jgi:hypothetical protein